MEKATHKTSLKMATTTTYEVEIGELFHQNQWREEDIGKSSKKATTTAYDAGLIPVRKRSKTTRPAQLLLPVEEAQTDEHSKEEKEVIRLIKKDEADQIWVVLID